MSTDKYRTVLEVDADIKGAEAGLGEFGKQLKQLSGESDAAAEAAAPLVRELEALEKATRAQQGLETASREVEELATQFTQAQKAVESASKSLEEADQRAKAARAGYDSASKSVEELTKEQKQLRESLKESGTQKEYVREKLKEVGTALKDAKKEQSNYSKELATSEKAVDSAADSLERKKDAVRETADAQKDSAKALEAWQNRAKAAGLDTDNLTKNAVNLKGRTAELAESSNELAKRLKDSGDAGKKAGQDFTPLRENLLSLAQAAAGLVALDAVTDRLKAAAKASAEFETAMAEVSTLLDDVGEMGDLRRGVEALSLEFGGDVKTNAKALYDVISAGAASSADAIETLRAANQLALGGVTDVSVAADGLTSALNAYGAEAGTATNVSDAFFTAVKAGKTTVAELSSSIGGVAPTAKAAGVSLEELLSGVAALTAGGVKTSQATTQLRSVISAIIAPSQQAKNAAKEMGIEFSEAALRSQGLERFLNNIAVAAGGNNEKISKLFGSVEALNGVLTLTGSGADKFSDTMLRMEERTGATEEAVAKMSDTAAARAANFQQSLAAMERALGDAVLAFAPLLDSLTATLNAFNNMEPGTQSAIAGFGALAVAVPAAALAIGGLVKSAQALLDPFRKGKAQLDAVSSATDKATKATGALALAMKALPLVAVAAGLALLATPAAEFAASFSDAAKALDEFTANRSATLAKEIGLLQEKLDYEKQGLDAIILTGKALEKRSAKELAAYAEVLAATEETLLVQLSLAARERELAELRGKSTVLYEKQLTDIRSKLEEVRGAQEEVAVATEVAASGWGQYRQLAIESSEAAKTALGGVREALTEVGGVSEATAQELAGIGEAGREALELAKAEVDRLNDSLQFLAGESSVVQKAFMKEFGAATEAVAELEKVLNDVRIESLTRLGLDAEEIATGLSKNFREAADAVNALGQSGVATAAELEAALGVLADSSKSQQETQKVIDLVRELGNQGKITTEAMQALVDRVASMADATDEVEAAFKRLGVTSRAELQRIAKQALDDYNTIRKAGTSSSKDIAAALDALAKRAEASGDRQILAFVESQRAALGLRDSIDEVAQSSKVAGDEMEVAGQRGAAAFDQAAAAADRLADAATRAGSAQAGGEGLGGQAVQGAGVPPAASALFNRLSSEFGADFLREYERIASVELTGRFTAAEAAQRASAIMERIARDLRRREGGEEGGRGGGTGDRRPGGLGSPVASQVVNINVTGVASADPKALDALARQLLPTISKLSRIGA